MSERGIYRAASDRWEEWKGCVPGAGLNVLHCPLMGLLESQLSFLYELFIHYLYICIHILLLLIIYLWLLQLRFLLSAVAMYKQSFIFLLILIQQSYIFYCKYPPSPWFPTSDLIISSNVYIFMLEYQDLMQTTLLPFASGLQYRDGLEFWISWISRPLYNETSWKNIIATAGKIKEFTFLQLMCFLEKWFSSKASLPCSALQVSSIVAVFSLLHSLHGPRAQGGVDLRL